MVSVCNRMIIDKMSKYIIIQVHTLFSTCAGVLKCFKCTCYFIEIFFISAPHVLEYFMKDRFNITCHLYCIFFHNLSIYSIWLRPDGVLHIIIFLSDLVFINMLWKCKTIWSFAIFHTCDMLNVFRYILFLFLLHYTNIM